MILGIIGLILPIMPGWVFLIPGLVILSDYFPRVKKLVDWAKHKAGYDKHTNRSEAGTDSTGDK